MSDNLEEIIEPEEPFLRIYQDAIKKMKDEEKKHGNSWFSVPIEDLVHLLIGHCYKIKTYVDALDIINYGLFLAVRLSK